MDRENIFVARWLLWMIITAPMLILSIIIFSDVWVSIYGVAYVLVIIIIFGPLLVVYRGLVLNMFKTWKRYIIGKEGSADNA